ncbi:MAG: asparagine synthase (glutamine-hydrolyzing) [Flavobacteriia bacterium]|nr:asparagine synthase (glutamine-hydrolyzing) [Flavobacteriia bacterium]
MCGILGSVNINFSEDVLNLIKHRGPDFSQICNYKLGDNKVLFGHRRLSIVDLTAAGNQPMETKDGNYSIILNGEIYNHEDLRKTINDINFKGHSDTETILNYIAKNGIQSVKDFNGIFAFCFLDKQEQKIYLVRDPFGVKPVYYYKSDNGFLFSSEIRPIKSLIDTSLDKDSLSELLKLRFNPSDDTLYMEIKKLLPGHCLTYDIKKNSIELKPLLVSQPNKKEFSFNQAVNQYGDLFEKAVKRQLMSDVELGVLLSGGIDSALVTYFAVRNSATKIKSFTVGFDNKDESNELDDARESASILNTLHHEIVIGQNDFINAFEKIVQIVEEPLGTTSSIPMYYLNQKVSKHVKVVLTGQGADEPLGGYPRYRSEIIRNNFPNFVLEGLKPFSSFFKNEKIRRFLYSSYETDLVKRFEKTYSLFTEEDIYKLTGTNDSRSRKRINYFCQLLNVNKLTAAEAMMAVDLRMNLADDLLLYTDKISMNFAIETRVPILDLELVEFIQSLPLKYKINNGNGKFIHKEFAKSVLPEKIVKRKKKGFLSPTKEWFNQGLSNLIYSAVNDDYTQFNRLFDKDEVMKVLEKHKKGYNQEKQLFLLLSIYFWLKNNRNQIF